jgi:hypothetical protein
LRAKKNMQVLKASPLVVATVRTIAIAAIVLSFATRSHAGEPIELGGKKSVSALIAVNVESQFVSATIIGNLEFTQPEHIPHAATRFAFIRRSRAGSVPRQFPTRCSAYTQTNCRGPVLADPDSAVEYTV